jgi:hypothetical protein
MRFGWRLLRLALKQACGPHAWNDHSARNSPVTPFAAQLSTPCCEIGPILVAVVREQPALRELGSPGAGAGGDRGNVADP